MEPDRSPEKRGPGGVSERVSISSKCYFQLVAGDQLKFKLQVLIQC